MKTLAILTPTYNRAYTLGKLYESLSNQTSFDFKWYIVDDGSNDNTREKCQDFLNEKFQVAYFQKENGGKHTALNRGIREISEELTIVVDSDDYLLPDAVETIVNDWKQLKDCVDVGGLSYYKLFPNGTVVGDRYPASPMIIDSFTNMRVNIGVRGDKAEVHRTALLAEFPFPEFEGEKFLSEAIVWNSISKAGHKLAFIDRGIYVCEYLPDGLTAAGRKNQLKNPLGTIEHARTFFHKSVNTKIRFRYMLLFAATQPFAKMSIKRAWKMLDGYKISYLVCLLPGVLLSIYWKAKYKL